MSEKNTTDNKKQATPLKVISARIPEELKSQLENVAKEERRPIGHLVAIILEDYLKKKPVADVNAAA